MRALSPTQASGDERDRPANKTNFYNWLAPGGNCDTSSKKFAGDTMSVAKNATKRLREALDAGQWQGGDRLPPERELARLLSIGRTSLRSALADLEAEGRIWRHVGQGTFVSRSSESQVNTTLVLAPPPEPSDVLELRDIIEPQIARLAAVRASSTEIEALEFHLKAGEAAEDWNAWEAADNAFHTTLARATRNPVTTGVLETLHDIRRDREWSHRRRATLTSARQEHYCRQHHIILEAVTRGDPDAAAQAMRLHLNTVQEAMVGRDVSETASA